VTLSLPFAWSDDVLRHEPGAEIWLGISTPGTELPARAAKIRESLRKAGAREVPAIPHVDDTMLDVHDKALVAFLRDAWRRWEAAGLPQDPGQDRVVPYIFFRPELTGGRAARIPTAAWAEPGLFAYDTMTLIGPGTWRAARAAVDVALTAVDLVVGGEPFAYACCRPPGHHVLRRAYGGSCYLNNAAIAAASLVRLAGGPVAVVDIDAHHGNGTQEVFYERADIRTASVHVDPGAGWFPHFVGFADETGTGAGEEANLNLPLAPGTGDEGWLAAVSRAADFAAGARALVVPLGVDAAVADPESPLEVTADGYREAGRLLGALELPTVVVQEGGYDLPTLGPLVVATLEGLQSRL
jgi:acetoin utilization deacetylase AcuC-like enzyme